MPKTKKTPARDRQCRPGSEHYVIFRNGDRWEDRLELLFGPFSYVSVMGDRLCVPDRSLSPGWTLAKYEPLFTTDNQWVLGSMTKKYAGMRMLSFQITKDRPLHPKIICPVDWKI